MNSNKTCQTWIFYVVGTTNFYTIFLLFFFFVFLCSSTENSVAVTYSDENDELSIEKLRRGEISFSIVSRAALSTATKQSIQQLKDIVKNKQAKQQT